MSTGSSQSQMGQQLPGSEVVEIMRLRISRLEDELEKAQSTIKRICQWIQSQHGIIVPNYLLNSESRITTTKSPFASVNESNKIDLIKDIKIKDLTQEIEFESNFSPSNLEENENEVNPFESEETIVNKNHGSNSYCTPCIVLLPPRLDEGQPHLKPHKKPNKLGSGFQIKKKVRPSEEQKVQAIKICKDRSHINKVFIFCPICPQRFSGCGKKGLFKHHLVNVHYFTKVDLEKCKFDQVKPRSASSIYTTDRKSQKRYNNEKEMCSICGLIFSKNYLENHISQVHTKMYNYFCSHCSAGYVLKGHLNQHMRTKHPSGDKIYKCRFQDCTKTFIKPSSFYAHRKIHQSNYICSFCGQIFRSKSYLDIHNVKMHSNVQPTLKCDLCEASYHFENDLEKHKKSHTVSVEKTQLCPVCGKSFFKLYSLKNHLLVHSEDKLYKCTDYNENGENCGFTFKQLQGLQSHKKRCHSTNSLGEPCQEVKKYFCDKCDMSFARRYGLKKHQRGVHEHLRPFKCTICSSAFKTKTNLKYHINTHSNPNSRKRGYNKPKDL